MPVKKVIVLFSIVFLAVFLIVIGNQFKYLYMKHELIKRFRSTPEADLFFRKHIDDSWRVVKNPERTMMFWNFLHNNEKSRDFFIKNWKVVLDELDSDPYLVKLGFITSEDSRAIDFWFENFDKLLKFHKKFPRSARAISMRPDLWLYMVAEHPEKGRSVLDSEDPASRIRELYEDYVIKKHIKL